MEGTRVLSTLKALLQPGLLAQLFSIGSYYTHTHTPLKGDIWDLASPMEQAAHKSTDTTERFRDSEREMYLVFECVQREGQHPDPTPPRLWSLIFTVVLFHS
jgi:hypothetical protein